MIGYIILSVAIVFISLIMSLVGLGVYHYLTDPYDMGESMTKFKDCCAKSYQLFTELKTIRDKMRDCPLIGKDLPPIEVYEFNDLHILIVGDSSGLPRLFVIKVKLGEVYEYQQLRDKSKKFKKQGLKHSLSLAQLETILNDAEKKLFKSEIEQKQFKVFKNHFKK